MLTRERASDIFDTLRRHTAADELELLVAHTSSALTRFANNTIHQNVAENDLNISVRVSFGGRTARATTNKQDEESLCRVVRSAEALASVQEEDPDFLPMPTPVEVAANEREHAAAPSRYFEATARMDPGERSREVGSMVDVAKRHGLTAAGIYSSSHIREGIFNSRGVADWYEQSLAEASVTMIDQNSSGWQKANSPDARNFDAQALAEIAAEKAVQSRDPLDLEPGKYTVILEPAAVLDMVGFMFWDFGGTALLEQRSFLNDRLGRQIFGDNITIWDDVYHPLQTGAAFDGEGMKRNRLKLVENGSVRELAYSRSAAARLGNSDAVVTLAPVRPSGHGFPLPNEVGEAPMNIVFGVTSGETKTVDQMITETEHGILVTRLWYIREVDPYEKILTGMTRDGTFLVQNGRVLRGVRNFRFNESLLRMLQHVDAMGEPQRASGEESFDMVVPPMRVGEFNFTETTKF